MGALRGAEGLLAAGAVRFLVMEFHPGRLWLGLKPSYVAHISPI